ncbi:cytochrome C oxidase subunit IV [Mangrovactinospora gilvigrisea]|uniref:Cytochrome c oxidase polypeptide 4 n=1 Tax=Mangrovactinospora gilvigrisea TaxID=1428644 RepID=A0A1J7BFU9_9ACTN|nr:cytochrome c oxidase subunit 4 [Mangrovactinospora gilvigrisea]OIV37555.1 cytochrome C oxidase subunit IV [Mangrovactinospora gilvigrisea]
MKFQGKLFIWLAVFLLAVAITYGVWSREAAGTTALFLAFALCLFIGYYLWFTARRIDSQPMDNEEGEVADDAGEVGFFSPHSWQPLTLALGGALFFLSVIFGWWLAFFSAPVIILGLFGWVFEYYRGMSQRY